MANLWVIVTGLAVLVRRENDSNIVLLRRVAEGTIVPPENGEEIEPHNPTLTLLSENLTQLDITDKDLDFRPDGAGTPTISDKGPFIKLGRNLEEPLKVQSLFTGSRNDVPAGWSRVLLSGGGSAQIWPIHVTEELAVKTISTDLKLELAEALDLGARISNPGSRARIGNGMLYYRQVAEAPRAVVNGSEHPMSPIAGVPASASPIQNGDYVAWVTNSAVICPERFDRDFFLLYDLLEDGTVTRFVPVLEASRGFVDDRRCPPGQCMTGYALA